jgi:hypothetical protein
MRLFQPRRGNRPFVHVKMPLPGLNEVVTVNGVTGTVVAKYHPYREGTDPWTNLDVLELVLDTSKTER